MKRKSKKASFEVVNPLAAGIDVGAMEHYVAVPAHLTEQSVRKFSGFTSDLHALGDWLVSLGITTVAMESTAPRWRATTGSACMTCWKPKV